jgi:3-oxoacyl-[acyl-carrier protein] reductase
MGRAGSGKIVFVLSSYTINVPPKALADYVTAKYSLLGLMKALASEYADKGVSINAVSPSMAETRFLSELPAKLVEMTADNHPQKRNARPDDIVPLIQFLLSKESSFITGANVPIAGGLVF